jgi:hypothetical protein
MTSTRSLRSGLVCGILLTLVGTAATACDPGAGEASPETGATGTAAQAVPSFAVDASWPQMLPDRWIMSQVTGIFVDDRDHVWVVHQPAVLGREEIGAAEDPPIAQCCYPAPPVLVFDRDGALVDSWDGPGEGYFWPDAPHGVFVDHDDHVWIGSNASHQFLKFTRDGQYVMTIGDPETSEGSNDPDHLGGPAGIWVNPETNEAFIADGYRNRRVVVYDAETGEYLRHWGAYGEEPVDDYEFGPRDADAPPARQFATVHGIIGSNDGHIYVADRSNSRVQAFREDGSFVQENVVAPGTLASGAAFDLALSPDPDQTHLYLVDGTNHKVWILRRDDLEVVGEFGQGGRQAGQFIRPHSLSIDSRGNLYVGEASTGRRVQRFNLQGPAAQQASGR